MAARSGSTSEIVETKVTSSCVTITLDNGVSVSVSSNQGSLHLHFSGTKGGIVATPIAGREVPNRLELANYVDLEYKTWH